MLKKIAKHITERLLPERNAQRLAPPTPMEQELIEALRKTFRDLPYEETMNGPESKKAWEKNLNRLRELVLIDEPREFLRWDVISGTMFIGNDKYIITELDHLRRKPDWNKRWREGIVEVAVGHPTVFKKYPRSSGNLIHHAYHISEFEEKTGVKVDNVDLVFEFGGGYGSMCRLFHNLHFKGRYVIFDFPHLSSLQTYFLRSIGIPVYPFDRFCLERSGVVCISKLEKLRNILNTHMDKSNSLFIATWSISETPWDFRNLILSLVSQFNSFMIAYQDNFGEIDNIKYFQAYKSDTEHEIKWSHWKIGHLPGNNYLMGIRA